MQQNSQAAKGSPGGVGGMKAQLVFAGIFIVAVAVVFFVFNLLTHGNFLEWMNIKIILANMVYPTFMAWGMCFLFACSYNDMSWGGVVVLASFATGVFGNTYGFAAGLVAGVVVGTALVFLNFCIFAFTKIPSWIASLSLAMIYEAVAVFLYTGAKTGPLVEASMNKELRVLGQLPWSLLVLAAGFVIIYFLYNRTITGFNIRAIGGNAQVSRSLGVNEKKTLLLVGLICGLLIGVTSFLQESYSGITTVKTGLSSIFLIFQPLAIALLADIMQKKINIVIAVPVCAFLLYAAFNLLTLMHVPSGTLQEALLCLFIIMFAIVGQRGVKGVVK
jgi:ribose/xylose/arabinose/galactoside ABC-type transport system permease subunit